MAIWNTGRACLFGVLILLLTGCVVCRDSDSDMLTLHDENSPKAPFIEIKKEVVK